LSGRRSAMKTIGLIGGMSWESSKEYYEIINSETRRALGKNNSAECVMYSCNFQRIEELQYAGDWERLRAEIVGIGKALGRAGADFAVLCTNTMHKVADGFERDAGLPLLHIADVVGERMRKDGVRKAGLLGTKFTMGEGFYKDRIRVRHGIDIEVPGDAAMEEINRVIYQELVKGEVKDSSRDFFEKEMDGLADGGCEAIVLGCTEIGMLIKESRYGLYDTTILHARRAVEIALAEGAYPWPEISR
jgi:aspartate racemase